MIAGTRLRVDIKAGALHAPAFRHCLSDQRLDPTLTIQHAFAFRHHHLEPRSIGRQGRPQGLLHGGNIVGAHRPNPFHAGATAGILDSLPAVTFRLTGIQGSGDEIGLHQ